MRPSFTLGIEEEYQNIDPETRDLRSHIATEMLAQGKLRLEERVKAEMHQSVIEVGTRVCKTIQDAQEDLFDLRRNSEAKPELEAATRLDPSSGQSWYLLGMIANASRRRPGRERRSIDEHRATYEALSAGDVELAVKATRVHLEGIEEDSLLALSDVASPLSAA